MTTDSSKNGAITSSRMNFSLYVGQVTTEWPKNGHTFLYALNSRTP